MRASAKPADTIRLVIITVPPPEVANAVQRLREPLCHRAKSVAALAYPPHVTLRTGVRVPPAEMESFLAAFGALCREHRPFPIRTDGIRYLTYDDAGVEKYIVGYAVAPSAPLRALNRHLLTYRKYRKSDRTAFHPHMTLVFDDLSRADWHALRAYIEAHPESFARSFEWICDHVGLYVLRDGRWEPYAVLPLAVSAPVDT